MPFSAYAPPAHHLHTLSLHDALQISASRPFVRTPSPRRYDIWASVASKDFVVSRYRFLRSVAFASISLATFVAPSASPRASCLVASRSEEDTSEPQTTS